MTEVYEPKNPWYALSNLDGMTKCVAVQMDEAKSRFSVHAPADIYKHWSCSMVSGAAGIQTIELPDIDPNDQSKENWQAAQDAAVALMTEKLEKQAAAIQQQLNGLKNLTVGKEI